MLGVLQKRSSPSKGAPDRRGSERFPIVRDVCYRVLDRRRASEVGTGKTVNISSTGVLFSASKPVMLGKRLELSISWPVRLDGECRLKLVVRGRVVRCEGTLVAIEMEKSEFHTQGTGALKL
jgi:hypothetical protein